MLPSPAALLLDFGGVLAEAARHDPAPPELVLRLYNLTDGTLSPGEINRALTAGFDAYAAWRDLDEPDELTHEEVWRRFVTPGWPLRAREAVRVNATRLSYDWTWRPTWALRPGIPEALRAARAAGLPMAVVSNTLCGAAHRDFLAGAGVGGLFAAQIYSDEAGVRKPNPEMIWYATRALGVSTEDCWFVGDSYRRDVVCARRAETAAAIVMRSRRTATEDDGEHAVPDVTVDDGFGLRDLLPF
ncbi:HAD family hydrolase [Pseudosporangium ferrugineum]|uniref:HAD superfamily hydrolase (TIGR01549 family) n=1 Tax=Pseudosporangium ferrugineum TaxID=439699 RepID=A0A2T0RU54_9ACTN|nr:HAD family hydrolase [Pseudosporangium ferrugineum]PRY24729.1 HAD superfamily hydrolase (TIGR01549 family) [Pseudosporangium ferrugineum]